MKMYIFYIIPHLIVKCNMISDIQNKLILEDNIKNTSDIQDKLILDTILDNTTLKTLEI